MKKQLRKKFEILVIRWLKKNVDILNVFKSFYNNYF